MIEFTIALGIAFKWVLDALSLFILLLITIYGITMTIKMIKEGNNGK